MSYSFDPEFEPHLPTMLPLPLEDLAEARALMRAWPTPSGC
jgi:hypothetical protein